MEVWRKHNYPAAGQEPLPIAVQESHPQAQGGHPHSEARECPVQKRILELYLNAVEWGTGVFGAEAASQHYYGKPASELSPQEAARLAVILPSPRRYNPLSGSDYIEGRVREVLDIMVKRGIVAPEEARN